MGHHHHHHLHQSINPSINQSINQASKQSTGHAAMHLALHGSPGWSRGIMVCMHLQARTPRQKKKHRWNLQVYFPWLPAFIQRNVFFSAIKMTIFSHETQPPAAGLYKNTPSPPPKKKRVHPLKALENWPFRKESSTYCNHPFSGAKMLVSGRVSPREDQIWVNLQSYA